MYLLRKSCWQSRSSSTGIACGRCFGRPDRLRSTCARYSDFDEYGNHDENHVPVVLARWMHQDSRPGLGMLKQIKAARRFMN